MDTRDTAYAYRSLADMSSRGAAFRTITIVVYTTSLGHTQTLNEDIPFFFLCIDT